MKEVMQLKSELNNIKDVCFSKDALLPNDGRTQFGEFQRCLEENKDLKSKMKCQKDYIQQLENEKASLITAMRLLMQDNNANHCSELTAKPSALEERVESPGNGKQAPGKDEQQPTNKNKHKRKKNTKSPSIKNLTTRTSEDTALPSTAEKSKEKNASTDPHGKQERSVIIGDSIVSKLEGWKMSNKQHRINVRAFPGSRIEDMVDYIKPAIKSQPDNLILHVGANNLKKDTPQDIAENIVTLCEMVEKDSPNTKIAVSELTLRQDSQELNEHRLSVNKILHSFARTRDWKVIKHEEIDGSSLNGRGLHLNRRGITNLARDFKQYLTNAK